MRQRGQVSSLTLSLAGAAAAQGLESTLACALADDRIFPLLAIASGASCLVPFSQTAILVRAPFPRQRPVPWRQGHAALRSAFGTEPTPVRPPNATSARKDSRWPGSS